MRKDVRDGWIDWSIGHEGLADCLYIDRKGYVTVGVGNLMEDIGRRAPASVVFELPWRFRDTRALAPREAIAREWEIVKARQDLADAAFARRRAITRLYLERADIERLVYQKLDAIERELVRQFPAFPVWPAGPQKALLSMSWARGEHGYAAEFPRFTRACLAQDWRTAADECRIKGDDVDASLKRRNEANRAAFLEGLRPLPVETPAAPASGAPPPAANANGVRSAWGRFFALLLGRRKGAAS